MKGIPFFAQVYLKLSLLNHTENQGRAALQGLDRWPAYNGRGLVKKDLLSLEFAACIHFSSRLTKGERERSTEEE